MRLMRSSRVSTTVDMGCSGCQRRRKDYRDGDENEQQPLWIADRAVSKEMRMQMALHERWGIEISRGYGVRDGGSRTIKYGGRSLGLLRRETGLCR